MSAASNDTRWLTRSCPVCEAACGLRVKVRPATRQILRVEGDPDDPRSRGFVCPKSQAVKGLHEDRERLRRPLRRRPDGAWEEVGWAEALDTTVERLLAVRDAHGHEALGVFIGNPSGFDAGGMTWTTPFMRALMTPKVFTAATMDHFPKLVASKALYGRASILPIPDLDRCDFFLCLGGNPVVSQGSLMSAPDVKRRLLEVRRRGRLVVVDPRRSETARLADEHHFITPGTDALLLFALVHTVFAEGLVRLGHLEPVVDGVEELRRLAEPFTPEAVAPPTGIGADAIRRLAREYARAERACCYGRIGTCTVEFGTLASWLVDVLGILTGHFDREGGMMFPRPPTGEAEAGRETGPFTIGRWRSAVRGLPEIDGQLSCAVFAEELEAPADGRVRGLITVAANPVLTVPNGQRVARALADLDFMVSIDIYLNETTRHADVILPTLSQAEKENVDLLTAGTAIRNYVRYSPATVAPDPGGMAHGQVLLELAARLSGKTAAAMEQELLESQARRLLGRSDSPAHGVPLATALEKLGDEPGPLRMVDLLLRAGPYGDGFDDAADGLSLAKVKAVPHAIDLGPLQPRLAEILRSPGRRIALAHPHLVQDVPRLRRRLLQPEPRGLLLIGRRQARNMNSHLHNLPALAKGRERCTLLVNGADARRLALVDGGRARVRSRVGEVVVPVVVDEDMMPGVVSLPHGYGHTAPGTRTSVAARLQPGVNSNLLTDDATVDPISGTCLANGIPVEVAPAP